MDNQRYYITLYGIKTVDWKEEFGSFTEHTELLVKDYINEACSTVTSSTANETFKFLYPHHIAKTYFLEGVVKGHITLAASEANVTFDNFRVSVCKMDDVGNEDELCSTGWIDINSGSLDWDGTYNIGEERVFYYEIDAWDAKEISENERIYVKIQTDSQTDGVLWHSNDSTWEDLKIEIPFLM